MLSNYTTQQLSRSGGIGFTFKKGPLELSPEGRYTRWANAAFLGNGFQSNLDQGDVLLGISF